MIVRTAGMERPKPEIRRDLDYLLRLWNTIRDTTLQSMAPCLIHEEGDLIKRSIRDLYSRDIDEILVAGEDGYKTAKSFMQLILPNHSKRVQPYRDDTVPIMQRYQVEVQLDAIHSPIVQLKSGGYIVINPTEALVAIDVNSGRATREKGIEETAIKTNIEAVDEVARQIRLRDLSGLIVIDFIDMEETRNIHAVERRIREAMKNDRARIQIGSISMFGLLELSRQRLRSSLLESSSEPCPHCQGTGRLRSIESTALHVLRGLEEEGMAHQASALALYLPTDIAFYILNHKRQALIQIEQRYGFTVELIRDDSLYRRPFAWNAVNYCPNPFIARRRALAKLMRIRPPASPPRMTSPNLKKKPGRLTSQNRAILKIPVIHRNGFMPIGKILTPHHATKMAAATCMVIAVNAQDADAMKVTHRMLERPLSSVTLTNRIPTPYRAVATKIMPPRRNTQT